MKAAARPRSWSSKIFRASKTSAPARGGGYPGGAGAVVHHRQDRPRGGLEGQRLAVAPEPAGVVVLDRGGVEGAPVGGDDDLIQQVGHPAGGGVAVGAGVPGQGDGLAAQAVDLGGVRLRWAERIHQGAAPAGGVELAVGAERVPRGVGADGVSGDRALGHLGHLAGALEGDPPRPPPADHPEGAAAGGQIDHLQQRQRLGVEDRELIALLAGRRRQPAVERHRARPAAGDQLRLQRALAHHRDAAGLGGDRPEPPAVGVQAQAAGPVGGLGGGGQVGGDQQAVGAPGAVRAGHLEHRGVVAGRGVAVLDHRALGGGAVAEVPEEGRALTGGAVEGGGGVDGDLDVGAGVGDRRGEGCRAVGGGGVGELGVAG